MVVIDLFRPLDSRGPEKCLTNEISVGLQANRCTECRLARVAKIVVDGVDGTLDAPFEANLEHFFCTKSPLKCQYSLIPEIFARVTHCEHYAP